MVLINEQGITPKQIAAQLHIHLENLSKTILDMNRKNSVTVANPFAPHGRVYLLIQSGKDFSMCLYSSGNGASLFSGSDIAVINGIRTNRRLLMSQPLHLNISLMYIAHLFR